MPGGALHTGRMPLLCGIAPEPPQRPRTSATSGGGDCACARVRPAPEGNTPHRSTGARVFGGLESHGGHMAGGRGDGESAYRRGSVRRPKATGWPSIYAAYLGIVPPKRHRTGCPIPCSALLQVGFTEPPGSPRALVRSYRTVSPLPVSEPVARAGPSAVCSLWHFPAGHPDWPLASTLPCGAPTFLSREARQNRTTRPRPPGLLIVTTILSRRPPWPRGQGARSRARLWNGHAGRPLSVVVGPPSDHRRLWSISQSAAGTSQ